MFHSARWDHDVTIDGARVGVIGTGSTAVQIVSAIVDRVAKLSLFQRTAQWIMPQENPAYTDEEKATFRADPDRLPALHTQLARDVRHLRERGGRRRLAGDQDDRGARASRTSRTTCATPSCASGCGPTTAPRASG